MLATELRSYELTFADGFHLVTELDAEHFPSASALLEWLKRAGCVQSAMTKDGREIAYRPDMVIRVLDV